MDNELNVLSDAGIDIHEAMENMCDDEEVFLYVLKEFLKDVNFDQFKYNFMNKNYIDAFHNAHALKGVLANFGMKEFFGFCSIVVEKLRKNDYYGIDELIAKMNECYNKLCIAIRIYIKNE